MLQLSPEVRVISYFEGATMSMSPAVRHVILEDIKLLLEGKRGEFLERRFDIGAHFLEICDNFGHHLSFPIKHR